MFFRCFVEPPQALITLGISYCFIGMATGPYFVIGMATRTRTLLFHRGWSCIIFIYGIHCLGFLQGCNIFIFLIHLFIYFNELD